MNNLELYNKVRVVPKEAQKEIMGGRLKGMTDINPMWRIKALTEHFGLCGIGWKYEIISERLEPTSSGEVAAFVQINLYIRDAASGHWSDAIPGTGGSSFIAKEKNGLYVSDECFKMALTDALSVACKALGFGADVYFAKDRSKYDQKPQPELNNKATQQSKPQTGTNTNQDNNHPSEAQQKAFMALAKTKGKHKDDIIAAMKELSFPESLSLLSMAQYTVLVKTFEKFDDIQK